MHFDFVDLKLFVNLATTKNLTRAAERSAMSLSSASARIRNLEDNLGGKLVYRHNQGVTLTPQGETFLHHASVILRQTDSLHSDMQEYSAGMKGHVRIFASYNASSQFLPGVLQRFLHENPGVSIDIEEHISRDIVRALLNGITDIGIVSSGVPTSGLEVLPYFRDHLVVVTSPRHPLAARQAIRFEEGLKYEFVGLPGTRWVDSFSVGSQSADNEKRMSIRIMGGSYESVCSMVSADIGISVMPESAANRHARNFGLKVVRLTDQWAASNLQICMRSFDQLPMLSRKLVETMSNDFRRAAQPARQSA